MASAEDPHLTQVNVERPTVGDISNVLQIKKLTGTFQFDSTVKKVTLVLEFYKNGEKLADMPNVAVTVDPVDGGDSGTFAIQIADLDYLQLGDGKKNHCRVVLELELARQGSKTTLNPKAIDVPKYKFDLGQRLIGNSTDWKSEEGNRRPVVMFMGGKSRFFNPSSKNDHRGQPRG
jgi:hypothetical protein